MCGMTSYLNGFVLLVYCLTVPILFHCTNPEEPLWGLYSAWLQKEFVTQQDTCWNSGACSKCMTMLMTLVPMVRIITILGLTASLIATYCDDFNPLDKYFRGVTNATCTYCPSATSSG